MRFVSGETREIRAARWDVGETVTIRRLSYGARKAIQQASQRVEPGEEPGTVVIRTDLALMDLAILEQGIAGWTFADAAGQAVAVTLPQIKQLREEDAEFILDEITAFNPKRTAEEEVSFRGSAGDGAAAGERAG